MSGRGSWARPSCLILKSQPGPLAWPPEPTRTGTLLRSLGELVTGIYAKYWIYVCAGMFIVVSFAGRLVVYKIVYMFLFLLCLTLFQVPGAGRWDPQADRPPCRAPHTPTPHPAGLLQPVAEAAQGVLVAGGGLHHAGAHRCLHLPVPGLPHVLAQPDRLH